uniref:MnbB n=1 Tax=Comamonas sp. JS46 TaxID=298265 RepID=Q5GDA2_9BURK|nr:MnbB [Comamonas sp. JS46]
MLKVKITSKALEARDIVSLELLSLDGAELPAFEPGAHIDLHVLPGVVRQYSLCGSPLLRHGYRVAVLRDPASRGGSAAVHDVLNEGDIVTIGMPTNLFPLAVSPHSLLFAGGIGITPILSMAQRLSRDCASFELHYCARSRERMAFLQEIGNSLAPDQLHLHLDDGSPEQRLDVQDILQRSAPGSHLYVCGPAGYISHVTDTARRLGWDEARIHFEHFGNAAAAHAGGDRPFRICIASSGRIVEVGAQEPATVALARAGLHVPVACEQGICGTCLTRIVEGVPEHRDMYLTEREKAANDQFLPCCSRAAGDLLVVDL